MRLAFALHASTMIGHYESIIENLPEKPDFLLTQPDDLLEAGIIETAAGRLGCRAIGLDRLPSDFEPYDAVISNHMHVTHGGPDQLLPFGKRHIRVMYALGKLAWNFSPWNVHYDAALCYGPYQQRIFAELFPQVKTAAVGYARLDAARGASDDRREVILGLGGDPDRQLLLWLPTVGELCSLDVYGDQLAGLNERYNVVVKPHPLTLTQAPATIERLKFLGFKVIEDRLLNNARLIKLADFVVTDYGGSLFAAIHLDTNIVLLNMTGDMFMDYAGPLSPEIHMRDHFVNIEPDQGWRLPRILADEALWREQRDIRKIYRENLFADIPVGEAGRQAASAIMRFAAEPAVSPKAFGPAGQLNSELARIIPGGVLERKFERSWVPTAMWGVDTIAHFREQLQAERKQFQAEKKQLQAEAARLRRELSKSVSSIAWRRIRRFFKGKCSNLPKAD